MLLGDEMGLGKTAQATWKFCFLFVDLSALADAPSDSINLYTVMDY